MPQPAINIDFDNLDFEKGPQAIQSDSAIGIDFENYNPPQEPEPKQKPKKDWGPEIESLKATGKAALKVPSAIAGSLILLPGAGIRAAIELIPKISTDPNKKFEPGSISKAAEVFEQIMSVPGELITTPEEQKAVENLGLAMKPLEMAGEGWRLIGEAANKGLMKLGFESTYIEPLLATYGEAAAIFALPEVIKKIKMSTPARMYDIKQRGLMVQSLADAIKKNPNMTQGQIIRTWDNPQWRQEALKARALKPGEIISVEKPIDFATKPTPSIKTEPTTELGKTVAKSITKERQPPPLAALKKREVEITKDQIDFEQPIPKEEKAPIRKPTKGEQAAVRIWEEEQGLRPKTEEGLLPDEKPKEAPKVAKPAEPEAGKEAWEMTEDEFTANPPKGFYLKKLSGEAIAQAMYDGGIAIDPDNFFGHSEENRKQVILHERAHFIEEKIKPEDKAGYFDVPEIMNYRGRNINEKLANMIVDGTLPTAVLKDYPDLTPAPAEKVEPAPAQEAVEPKKAKKAGKGGTTLYSGVPILEGLKLKKELEALYDKHIGTPLWDFLSDDMPKALGDRSRIVDAINKGLIVDYKKDPAFIEVRDDTINNIEKAKELIKEISLRINQMPKAVQLRMGQIIEGSITSIPKYLEDSLTVAKKFKELLPILQKFGILGPDNRFGQFTKKEIAKKFQEIDEIDKKITILKKRLEPIIRRSKTVRRVAEDIAEEMISSSTDETTGTFETRVSKWTQINESRVKEALTARGFGEGEADQMIQRIKESVIPLENQKGTLKEIRTKVEKVVTKTIIQEIETLKTYTPSMMARARNSIVKEIGGLVKDRKEISERIHTHYIMSGKQYLRRAYEKYEGEKSFLQKLYSIAKKPRLIKGYEIQRKDLSYLYVKDVLGGKISVPKLVYKGLSSETHDALLVQMFDKISKNKDWAISVKEWDNIMSLKGRGVRQEKYRNFKPLPVSKKLGPLSGAMVDPYIWDDLNQAVAIRSKFIKGWDDVLKLWKTGKVVYNPAAQARNFLSNSVLADFAGVPHTRIDLYARAARDLLTKSGYYEEAKKNTSLFGKEWAGTEIKQFLMEAKDLRRIGDESILVKIADVFKKLSDKPGDLYQANEQYFKLLVYSHQRETGATIKDAAKHAEKWLFNYQKIPPAIRWAKRWYSPFITFSYKAMPRFAETVVRKPWKIAKYGILLAIIEEITRRMLGESEEEVEREKKVLPDYMRKTILPGQISHLRIPYTDKYGRSKYLDLSFILPWGDVAEQWGQSHLVGRPFLPNHPLYTVIAEVAFNEVLFTGEKLTEKDLDTGSEYIKRIGTEIWRQAMPSLAGSYSYNKFVSAFYGELDWMQRERSVGEAVFDVFFGLKIRSIDFDVQHARRIQGLRKTIDKVRQRFADDYDMLVLRQPNMDSAKKEAKYLKLVEKKDKDIQKIMDIITDIEQ